MTTFEYFKNQYDERHDYAVKCINSEIEIDSYHFVEIAWKNFFGCTVTDNFFNINGVDDTQEMIYTGYLKKREDHSWKARQLGRDHMVALTAKGLKKFYQMMF